MWIPWNIVFCGMVDIWQCAMVDLFFAHFRWYLLPVFRIFWELLDGGPGGPVCRYLSPLPAHLALPKLSRRTSFPLFQGKWEQRTELRVVSQNHTLCPPRRTFCQVFVAFLKPFLRAFGKIPPPRRKMISLPYFYYYSFSGHSFVTEKGRKIHKICNKVNF